MSDRSGSRMTSGSKMEMMRYCAVLGCRSSAMELRAWRKGACEIHVGEIRERCDCDEPFVLFQFPSSPKFRSIWLSRIGLPELEISDATRVCSLHFVEGKPTSRSFFPTLYLQPDISDDEEANEDHDDELHPQIDSTYSCVEVEGLKTDNIDASDHNQSSPLRRENSSREESATINFLSEEDSGSGWSVGPAFTSDNVSLKESVENAATMDNEMIIAEMVEEEDDEVVLVEEKDNTTNDDDVQVMYEKPKVVPLASYDPQAQVLQISNPVKYISECHNRIAQLISEKEEMKTSYEKEIERLKYLNTSLKRRFLNSNKLFITATSRSSGIPKTRKKKLKVIGSVSKQFSS